MADVEEGELEDGELLSSDEEDQGEPTKAGQVSTSASKDTVKEQTVSDTKTLPKLLEDIKPLPLLDKTRHTSPQSPNSTAGATAESKEDTEDGEIFSDDEEAAYYPQHVRSRPRAKETKSSRKASDTDCHKSSDSESLSGIRSERSSRDRRERERNLRSSPESETDGTHHRRSTRSRSKDRGLFFEDRDGGSGSESTGSRDRTRSRSRERDKDHRSSPKYSSRHGNRTRERDRSSRSRNEDDSSDRSSHYSRQSGGYSRTRGGYGSYQQRGGYSSSKFQGGGVVGAGGGGGSGSHGGYSSSVQPGLMNTGMTAHQFHQLALKVKKRREDGLPLLPQPNLDKCGNLDQYNYPAQPSWYLEEVEAWEKREREEEKERAKGEVNQEEKTETVEKSDSAVVVESKRPISPLFRRNSSIALEIVSSPVSDDESPMVVAESTANETEREPVPLFEIDTQSHNLHVPPKAKEEPAEMVSSTESGPLVPDGGKVSTVKQLKELAANVVRGDVEANTAPSMATSTGADAATIATVSTTTIAIETSSTVTPESSSTSATPQSDEVDLLTSTAEPSLPTSNSVTEKCTPLASPTKPTPTIMPLIITNESTVDKSDDQLRSPSLSPTIPIQSSSLTKGAATTLPAKTFRPKIMSDSDSEGDYDDYLDQLDQEEEVDDVITKDSSRLLTSTLSEGFPVIGGSSASNLTSLFEGGGNKDKAATNQILDSIGDPLSEDFPSIGKEERKSSSNEISLMSLIGEDASKKQTASGEKKSSKSSRRKQKDSAWWAKQKEKEKTAAVVTPTEETKKAQPCKYYLNGNCKNGDSCTFSHDCAVQKKKEICKFYLQGYCSKGSLCLYYHETFPCKYMHTKGYCKNGDQCRFSHAPLTQESKELLIPVLEPAQVAALNASMPSSNEPSANVGSLVVSIPKEIVKGLIVSIPLSKLQRGVKHPPVNPSSIPHSNAFPPPGAMPPPQQYQNQPPSRGPFPFQQQSGNPVPFLPNARPPPPQFGAPPHAPPPNQSQPVPLFPPKNQFQPPPFPPNQAPPPPMHRMPHPPPHGPPGGHQRKSLLPTPPPHMMISPEDIKRMENSQQQEYWEAPELSQRNPPAPYQQQQAPPSMGGAPSFNGHPPNNQFGQSGGFHQLGPGQGPPPPRAPPPFPPQQPPLPQLHQFGPRPPPPPPGQQQPHPVFHPPAGPYPPGQQWNEPQAGGMGMRQQPGMEPNPPPGMDPRQSQAGGAPPLFPPSQVDPRQKQQGPPGVNPHGGHPRGDISEGRAPDHLHQPPPPPQLQPAQPWRPETAPSGGWSQPPPVPGPPGGHLGPGGQTAGVPYQRHNGGGPPPHAPAPSMPHLQHGGFGGPHPNPGVPFQQQSGQPVHPYHSHSAAAGMSPPQKVGGSTQAQAPPPIVDKPSPVWGMSPEHSGSQSPGAGGSVATPAGGDHMRRRDPRMKYAHLKIKSKGQTSQGGGQSSNSQPILKRGAGEAGMESSGPGFKIPRLLQDSSALNRPLDPGELFGGKDALSGGEEREYSEITAPFGAFRSMFAPQPSDADGGDADSAGPAQQFGEITMEMADLPAAKTRGENNDAGDKEPPSSSKDEENNNKTPNSKPSELPSYLADLNNMGLGDDLKIDSAFGSLSDKNSKQDNVSKGSSTSQDSQARKLPSIFGFS